MTTIALNKQCGGYYTKTVNGITITVCSTFSLIGEGSKDWQLVIENEEDVVISAFYNTKKDAYKDATKWVIENM